MEFLKWLWQILMDLWPIGLKARIWLLVVAFIAVISIGELAQSNLLGDRMFRVAARVVPWQPIFRQRAALEAGFWIQRSPAEAYEPLLDSSNCPPNSIIRIKYVRNRIGWVSVFGLSETSPYPIRTSGYKAQELAGGREYTDSFQIKSANGQETIVIVGADKPFDSLDQIIPAIRRARDGMKGGVPLLDGYDVGWSDTPVFVTCFSGSHS